MTIDPKRRAMLTAKYSIGRTTTPDRPPWWRQDQTLEPPAENPIVQGILDSERIAARLTSGETDTPDALFDPIWNPKLYAKAQDALRELHTAEAEGRFEYKTYNGVHYNPDDATNDDRVVLLKFPYDRRIFVCRNSADRFAAMFDRMGPFGACDIQIVDNCYALRKPDVEPAVPTCPLPLSCGRIVLLFEICEACHLEAGLTADTNRRVGILEAMAKLPPGAVIDQGGAP